MSLCASQVSDQPFNFTGTYTIGGVSGSNSVTLNPVVTNSGPVLSGGITITVFPALAPNRWGSPSWNAWASNAVTAILNGYSSYGDPSSPTFYQQITNAVPVTNNMVTSFPSWMGSADPGDVFGPAFAQESGNRLTFGMDIKGGTNLISIAQLSFTMTSTDPSNTLDWTYSPIPYSYSGLNTGSANPVYLGIIYGPNGQNTYVTNGPATQLVNEIITCGSGNAWWPDGTSADSIATQQSNIVACATQLGTQPFFFTGTYTIDGMAGTNSVTFNPVVANSPPSLRSTDAVPHAHRPAGEPRCVGQRCRVVAVSSDRICVANQLGFNDDKLGRLHRNGGQQRRDKQRQVQIDHRIPVLPVKTTIERTIIPELHQKPD